MLDKLIEVTEGDLRRSINTLQTCSSFGKHKELTSADIEAISGSIPMTVVLKVDKVVSQQGVTYSDI